ncbi:uncharacterized protein LOC131158261 [Malania oleifera]|uniref:uncharacterized protein LOC131158261 n=1 Tax=Malania oleifera TaxID=397392 RepID=UPI0025ADA57A|nr:uncharacterized protein LOC131158261 [Malania oleifera]
MGNEELGFAAVEEAKTRCRRVMDRIERLPYSTNITPSSKRTLLRLANSELSFLSSSSSSSSSSPNPPSFPICANIGHLEAVVHILEQSFVTGVSRVCKPLPINSHSPAIASEQNRAKEGVYVDIVCTLNGNPVWFVVSDRNPKYISWDGSRGNDKGLRLRIHQVFAAASVSSLVLKPSSLILFFAKGLDDSVCKKLQDEFGAFECQMGFSNFDCDFSEDLEGDWIHVLGRSYQEARVLEIKVDCIDQNAVTRRVESHLLEEASGPELWGERTVIDLGGSFCSLISGMKFSSFTVEGFSREDGIINFDTTALIALVSGISNGGTGKLLATPESELRRRFKGNFEFVIAQVSSEIQNPIHAELHGKIFGRKCIICESVHSEFKELVLMCGGSNEKVRADWLLECLIVVPDSPSTRIMSLPTTRKLALKNKVVFGTGDYWHAPTLTANMAFVRAVSQTGLSLFTIEHRPRALTGD